jgi:ABC-2 type transport system permease protein
VTAVLRHALRQVRKLLVALPLAAGGFHYLVLFSSSSFVRTQPDSPFLRRVPKTAEAFLGGRVDFLSPTGWLAAAMTHPVSLALLVGAALAVAAGAVATEVERGTVELVLARPVPRWSFLLGKAGATWVAVSAVELGAVAGVLLARATVEGVGGIGLGSLGRAFLGSWLLFGALGMVGLAVSARSSLRGRAIGVSVAIVVGAFFLRFVALLIDRVSALRFASPFHYFRPPDLLTGQAMGPDLGVLAALAAASLALAGWWFARRDLAR